MVILTWPRSLIRLLTFSFTFTYISGINVSEKYLSEGKLYHGSIEFIKHLKPTRWTMLNSSLSTAIISPISRWICRVLGWSKAYGFPVSNTWAIVDCFLLANSLALACACSSTSNSEEWCTAPNVLSSGVCGGYLWCTTLHFYHPPKRFLRKSCIKPCFHRQHLQRSASIPTGNSPGHRHWISNMYMCSVRLTWSSDYR